MRFAYSIFSDMLDSPEIAKDDVQIGPNAAVICPDVDIEYGCGLAQQSTNRPI